MLRFERASCAANHLGDVLDTLGCQDISSQMKCDTVLPRILARLGPHDPVRYAIRLLNSELFVEEDSYQEVELMLIDVTDDAQLPANALVP